MFARKSLALRIDRKVGVRGVGADGRAMRSTTETRSPLCICSSELHSKSNDSSSVSDQHDLYDEVENSVAVQKVVSSAGVGVAASMRSASVGVEVIAVRALRGVDGVEWQALGERNGSDVGVKGDRVGRIGNGVGLPYAFGV